MKQFNLEEIMKNGGRCQTRDGRAARIICTDLNSAQPIVAVVNCFGEVDGEEFLRLYSKDGHFYTDGIQCEFDLVPLPRRLKREYWVNIYPRVTAGNILHFSKSDADSIAMSDRVACVKVVIDCEEGEGLEEAT